MPDVVVRISVFTRINIILGALAVSLAPLIWTWSSIRDGSMDEQSWIVLIVELAFVQALSWHAQKRCSSEQLRYWDGVAVAAASIRTQWIYTDVVLALLLLPLLFAASAVLAFTSRPAHRFHRLVHGFYRNRMQQ